MKKTVTADPHLVDYHGTGASALAEALNLMPPNSREWALKNRTPP